MTSERIVTDSPLRHLWARLSVLESTSGAEHHLRLRAEELGVEVAPETISKKAQGLAFTLRTAREHFRGPADGNLTSTCLGFYYGTLSLLQALPLADPRNMLTLEDMEAFTKGGHGMGSLTNEEESFPEGEYVFLLTNGFLPRFLRAESYPINLSDVALERNYRTFHEVPDEHRPRLVSVASLLSRVPELLSVYCELFRRQPDYLGIQIVGADPNARIHFPKGGNSPFLTPDGIRGALEWNDDVHIEWSDNDASFRTSPQAVSALLEGKARYESPLAYSSYIIPIHGITDGIIIQFMILYALSIWVRYRPALWREIHEGSLDQYRSIVAHFLIAVERVVPNAILDRLYDREFLFAPFSYWS